MKLPPPKSKLCGCNWLPRIIEKARLMNKGDLPPDYVRSFCNPAGVDGKFIAHFSITKEDILAVGDKSDDEIAAWFKSIEGMSDQKIRGWNELSENLGRSGYPMHERFQTAITTVYHHVSHLDPQTVFDVLEADEGIEEDRLGNG